MATTTVALGVAVVGRYCSARRLWRPHRRQVWASDRAGSAPKRPVGNLGSAGVPFVGEREHDEASPVRVSNAARHCHPGVRPDGSAFANRVHAGFAEHQRAFPRLVPSVGQVAAEVFLAMEVHVERNEIEKTQIEILGRGIVRVGEKRAGIDLFSQITEFGEKAAVGAGPCQRTISDRISLPML